MSGENLATIPGKNPKIYPRKKSKKNSGQTSGKNRGSILKIPAKNHGIIPGILGVNIEGIPREMP